MWRFSYIKRSNEGRSRVPDSQKRWQGAAGPGQGN